MSSDPLKYFVQLHLGSKIYKTKVSTVGCCHVDDFRESIKKAFSPELDSYGSVQLVIFQPDGVTEIDPGTLVTDLDTIGIGPWTPIVVKVDQVPLSKPAISTTKLNDYKRSKAAHSSRSYLTSIAFALDKIYPIPVQKSRPITFGDILHQMHQTNPHPKKGVTVTRKRLRNFLDGYEWELLAALNTIVNSRLHSELSVAENDHSRQLILPTDLVSSKEAFQEIALKAGVVADMSQMIVKSEGSVSRV
jgi:hypothetical protein